MENTPLVSVIIPCYNAALYVQQAVDSALRQTYTNIEVIVVDDGSADNSLQVLHNSYAADNRVKILTHANNANLGVSKTRKAGIDAAMGAYIAYLDADDLFLENKIEAQLKIFQENPLLVLVHSSVQIIADKGRTGVKEFRRFETDKIYSFLKTNYLKKNDICNSSVMVPRKIVAEIPNFFDQVYQYEDWINWILIAQQGNFFYINKPLAVYRYHPQSFTSDVLKDKLKKNYAALEMTLILLSRVSDKQLIRTLNANLYQQLEKLYGQYQPEKNNKRLTFYTGFLYSVMRLLKPKRKSKPVPDNEALIN